MNLIQRAWQLKADFIGIDMSRQTLARAYKAKGIKKKLIAYSEHVGPPTEEQERMFQEAKAAMAKARATNRRILWVDESVVQWRNHERVSYSRPNDRVIIPKDKIGKLQSFHVAAVCSLKHGLESFKIQDVQRSTYLDCRSEIDMNSFHYFLRIQPNHPSLQLPITRLEQPQMPQFIQS